jgi:hypothetical protein
MELRRLDVSDTASLRALGYQLVGLREVRCLWCTARGTAPRRASTGIANLSQTCPTQRRRVWPCDLVPNFRHDPLALTSTLVPFFRRNYKGRPAERTLSARYLFSGISAVILKTKGPYDRSTAVRTKFAKSAFYVSTHRSASFDHRKNPHAPRIRGLRRGRQKVLSGVSHSLKPGCGTLPGALAIDTNFAAGTDAFPRAHIVPKSSPD